MFLKATKWFHMSCLFGRIHFRKWNFERHKTRLLANGGKKFFLSFCGLHERIQKRIHFSPPPLPDLIWMGASGRSCTSLFVPIFFFFFHRRISGHASTAPWRFPPKRCSGTTFCVWYIPCWQKSDHCISKKLQNIRKFRKTWAFLTLKVDCGLVSNAFAMTSFDSPLPSLKFKRAII